MRRKYVRRLTAAVLLGIALAFGTISGGSVAGQPTSVFAGGPGGGSGGNGGGTTP